MEDFRTSCTSFLDSLNIGRKREPGRFEVERRKPTTYPIYKMVNICSDILLKFKRVKRTEFEKFFNINLTNRIVGFSPDFVGASRSRPVSAKNLLREFIADSYDEIVSKVSQSCINQLSKSIDDARVTYSAGYDSCTAHLREYLKDNTTEDSLPREEILRILSLSNFKWFKAPKCSFLNGKEIFTMVRSNLNAFAGHYTTKIFGSKKERSDSAARTIAYKMFQRSKIRPIKNLYLWSVLGREKDIKVNVNSKDEKEVGTRVILTCEHPITILLLWISQKFNYILGYTNWEKNYNIIGEFNNEKYSKLLEYKRKYDYELEADWSYYDSNIDTNFLEIAGAMLCCGVDMKFQVHRNLMYTFISSIVTKYILMPPGVVVELNRSQPSGHPAGTLVNCNVNLIYWSLIGYKIYGDNYADYMHVEVYGDDTRAYFKDHPNLIHIDRYIKECGLKSDPVIDNFRSTHIDVDPEYQIDFLKRRFDENGMIWNHKKMFDRWLYQSKNRNINDQVDLIMSYYQAVPTDKDLASIVRIFINWVKEKHFNDLTRNNVKNILSAESLLGGDTDRLKYFTFHTSGTDYTKSYDSKMNLHSFSVSRPRLYWFNENFKFNLGINKLILLDCLSRTLEDIAESDVYEEWKTFRPPPLAENDFDRGSELYEAFYNSEVNKMLRYQYIKFAT